MLSDKEKAKRYDALMQELTFWRDYYKNERAKAVDTAERMIGE